MKFVYRRFRKGAYTQPSCRHALSLSKGAFGHDGKRAGTPEASFATSMSKALSAPMAPLAADPNGAILSGHVPAAGPEAPAVRRLAPAARCRGEDCPLRTADGGKDGPDGAVGDVRQFVRRAVLDRMVHEHHGRTHAHGVGLRTSRRPGTRRSLPRSRASPGDRARSCHANCTTCTSLSPPVLRQRCRSAPQGPG